MDNKLSELKAAALAATPGPWHVVDQACRWNIDDDNGVQVAITQQRTSIFKDRIQQERTANADFIAAANPAVVLSLLAELEKKDREIAAIAMVTNDQVNDVADHWRNALIESQTELEEKDRRIAELENDEVRQRLANAEHQLHMAELANHNLRASRKAQFRKRKAAEAKLANREAQPVQSLDLAGWQFKSVNGDWLGFFDEHGKNIAVREGCEVREVYTLADALNDRGAVREAHAEWSQSTFGNVGPIGPLKHLSKEALEAAAQPDDLSEWADMQFLLWDAQRRAGITDEQITQAMIEKLAVNKQREWPEPKDGEPRLHITAPPAPAVPVVPTPVNFSENADADTCRKWAWEQVKELVSTDGWTLGDNITYFGFFCWGWDMRRQYNEQRPPAPVVNPEFTGAPSVPDERAAFESFIAQKFGEAVERRRAENGDNEYMAWDMAVAWIVWQRRAMLNHVGDATDKAQPVSQRFTSPKWIACSEGLPDYGVEVLCYAANDVRWIASHVGGGIFDDLDNHNFITGITHWMPLPAAPEGGKCGHS